MLPVESGALPAVSITAPITGAMHIAPAAYHLQANATPATGSSIAAVEFYLNGNYVGRDTVSPYGLSVGNIATGDVTFAARVIDASGTVSWSQPVTVSVRSANPTPVFLDVAGIKYFGLQMYRHAAVVNRSDLLEFSPNMREWAASPVLHETEEIGLGVVKRVYRSSGSVSTFPSGFLRVTTDRTE